MKFTDKDMREGINGVAALAILRMLFDTLMQKKILTEEEVEIILNCAAVDVDTEQTDLGGEVARVKALIGSFLSDDTEQTLG